MLKARLLLHIAEGCIWQALYRQVMSGRSGQPKQLFLVPGKGLKAWEQEVIIFGANMGHNHWTLGLADVHARELRCYDPRIAEEPAEVRCFIAVATSCSPAICAVMSMGIVDRLDIARFLGQSHLDFLLTSAKND